MPDPAFPQTVVNSVVLEDPIAETSFQVTCGLSLEQIFPDDIPAPAAGSPPFPSLPQTGIAVFDLSHLGIAARLTVGVKLGFPPAAPHEES